MSNYEIIQLEDIKWNNKMSDIKKNQISILEINKPNKEVNKIKKKKRNILFDEKSFDNNLDVILDTENNII